MIALRSLPPKRFSKDGDPGNQVFVQDAHEAAGLLVALFNRFPDFSESSPHF